MAALDFPASPSLNQVYSANGRSWIWDGTAWNPYGSGISDGDRGDITVSAGGSQWDIDPEAVTYAKMQNVSAASRLLGRGSASGAGDVEEISLGTGLSMTGTTLSATGGGTVTSVDVSGGTTGLTTSGGPITGSGTITLAGTLAIANGGTGQTTQTAAFDALAPTTTKGDLIVHNGTDNIRVPVGGTNGHVLTVDSAEASGVKWAAAGGGGSTLQYAQIGSNVNITDNATFQNITGLSFSAAANTSYRIRFHMAVSTSATSTGYEVGINGPASPTGYFAIVSLWNSATAETASITNSTTYGSIGSNANSGGGTARPCEGIILFHNGANAGTFNLQGKVETAVSGTVTFETGSFMTWEEVTT